MATLAQRIDRMSNFLEILKCDRRDYSKLEQFLFQSTYLKDPASASYHGTNEGDLFEHSACMADTLDEMTEKLGLHWSFRTSPILVGLVHDLCKVGEYLPSGKAYPKWIHANKNPLGHGDKSVIMLKELFPQLTEEEMYCIRWHMGAFDYEKNWLLYNAAITKFPNVLYTHTADMVASKIRGI